MIRPTIPVDTPSLLMLAKETNVFKPIEIQALNEVLDDFHASDCAAGHLCVTYVQDGAPIGFAYYAPTAMTDRNWCMYWIVVKKANHAQGIGGEMLRYAEAEITRQNGRLLIIETSSLPHYEATRRFYLKHNYEVISRIPDWYAEGDVMIMFRKRVVCL
jgi:GNAT superfamily N-acetyltransferase